MAARVNGAEISVARLEGRFEEYLAEQGRTMQKMTSPRSYKRLKREALEELIDRELLWQEAKKSHAAATEAAVEEAMQQFRAQFEDEFRMRNRLQESRFTLESYREYVRQELSIRRYVAGLQASATVTDEEVHAFYVDNPARFTRPEAVRARHILIKISSTATDADKAAARKKIEALLAQAKAGEDFAALAKSHSQDTTAAAGGDLGFFGRGSMVRPFEDAAFALRPGEISDAVETPFGLHIIKLEARHDAALVPEAEAREVIQRYLTDAKMQSILQEKLSALRAAAKIEVLIPL